MHHWISRTLIYHDPQTSVEEASPRQEQYYIFLWWWLQKLLRGGGGVSLLLVLKQVLKKLRVGNNNIIFFLWWRLQSCCCCCGGWRRGGVTYSCILSRTFEKQKWIGTYLGLGPFGHAFVHYGGSSMAQVFPKHLENKVWRTTSKNAWQ